MKDRAQDTYFEFVFRSKVFPNMMANSFTFVQYRESTVLLQERVIIKLFLANPGPNYPYKKMFYKNLPGYPRELVFFGLPLAFQRRCISDKIQQINYKNPESLMTINIDLEVVLLRPCQCPDHWPRHSSRRPCQPLQPL
jgi:hypothetical protein